MHTKLLRVSALIDCCGELRNDQLEHGDSELIDLKKDGAEN